MKIYVTVPGVKKDIYRALLHQYINFVTKKVDSTSQCFGSGYFGRIRLFRLDPGILVDPCILVGSGYFSWFRVFGWFRVFVSVDPVILVGSGILVGFGYFGWIRVF